MSDYTNDLLALDIGDVVEVQSPITPVSEEPVVMALVSKTIGKASATKLVFDATLYGVPLYQATCTITKKGLSSWTAS